MNIPLHSFNPRFLIGTPGCIGAGLDCDQVHLVCRVGMPNSILDFIQEMGRCGRNRGPPSLSNTISSDWYSLSINLKDYVYLIERIFITNDKNQTQNTLNTQKQHNLSQQSTDTLNNNSQTDNQLSQQSNESQPSGHQSTQRARYNIISKHELQQITIANLNSLCQMVLLRFGCWHQYVELKSSNPFTQANLEFDPCNNHSPFCDGSQQKIVKKIY